MLTLTLIIELFVQLGSCVKVIVVVLVLGSPVYTLTLIVELLVQHRSGVEIIIVVLVLVLGTVLTLSFIIELLVQFGTGIEVIDIILFVLNFVFCIFIQLKRVIRCVFEIVSRRIFFVGFFFYSI